MNKRMRIFSLIFIIYFILGLSVPSTAALMNNTLPGNQETEAVQNYLSDFFKEIMLVSNVSSELFSIMSDSFSGKDNKAENIEKIKDLKDQINDKLKKFNQTLPPEPARQTHHLVESALALYNGACDTMFGFLSGEVKEGIVEILEVTRILVEADAKLEEALRSLEILLSEI